jgi:hypothetical protein
VSATTQIVLRRFVKLSDNESLVWLGGDRKKDN